MKLFPSPTYPLLPDLTERRVPCESVCPSVTDSASPPAITVLLALTAFLALLAEFCRFSKGGKCDKPFGTDFSVHACP